MKGWILKQSPEPKKLRILTQFIRYNGLKNQTLSALEHGFDEYKSLTHRLIWRDKNYSQHALDFNRLAVVSVRINDPLIQIFELHALCPKLLLFEFISLTKAYHCVNEKVHCLLIRFHKTEIYKKHEFSFHYSLKNCMLT